MQADALTSEPPGKPQLAPKEGHGNCLVTVVTVLLLLWSVAGLIHYSFLSAGKTIISEKYAQQMDEMH